ncbi:MAG TPA: amidohydrolase family protein [Pseudolabrys sp.]|nr:amidohydrolase family protein [Pseudolabrys sp.]
MIVPLSADSQQPGLVLRGGRVLKSGGRRPERLDIAITRGGSIARLAPSIDCRPDVPVADISDRLVTAGLVDIHQHLDKTRTRQLLTNADSSLQGAIAAFQKFQLTASRKDILMRARQTVEACIARGTVAIRTHVNVGPNAGLRGIEALAELRESMKDRVRLQIVAFLSREAGCSPDSAAHWLDAAVAAGADCVGGAPAHADDADAFLDIVFDVADRRDVSIDLHVDEHLDSTAHRIRSVIERTLAGGLQKRVVAGHCSALGALPRTQAATLIEKLALAKISIVTLPAANLYLLGRDVDCLPPRGLTRVKDLIAAGIPVAAGSDNIQDAFVPVGTGDLLETARWTVLAGHLDASDLGAAFRMITTAPAAMMNLEGYGIHEGSRADLLIADAEDEEDMVASGPVDRTVLFAGKVVSGRLTMIS